MADALTLPKQPTGLPPTSTGPAPTPTFQRVAEGGQELNLGQASDAIENLGLFEDLALEGDPPAKDPKKPRGKKLESNQPPDSETDEDDPLPDSLDADGTDDVDGEAEPGDDGEVQDPQDPANDGEQEPIQTLAQLSEAMGGETDSALQLTDTFTADGVEVTVTLADLRKGYQRESNYTRLSQELSENRKALETEHTQAAANMQRELAVVGQVLQQGEQYLLGTIDDAAMQTLRVSNAAEWTARREEIGQRINGIRQLYHSASQQFEQYEQQKTEALATQMTAHKTAELESLRAALPDWDDTLRKDLAGYLGTSYGYTPDDLKDILDHRHLLIANKARKWDQMQALSKKTKQTLKTVPKLHKAGKTNAGNRLTRQGSSFKKATAKLKTSGKMRDAADLLNHIPDL